MKPHKSFQRTSGYFPSTQGGKGHSRQRDQHVQRSCDMTGPGVFSESCWRRSAAVGEEAVGQGGAAGPILDTQNLRSLRVASQVAGES